jgi:hypothetical protein
VVYENYFRTNFYFNAKTRDGVLDLNIDEKIKLAFAEAEMPGKNIQLPFFVATKKQLHDVMEVIRYKKMLK